MAMTKYIIYGHVDCNTCVELGEFETRHRLAEIWDLIVQIFNSDNLYREGIFARRKK